METKHDNKQYDIFISYRSMHKAWVDLPRAPVRKRIWMQEPQELLQRELAVRG